MDSTAILSILTNHGPLMLFFLAVGYAISKWAPKVASYFVRLIEDVVAALNRANAASQQNHELFTKTSQMWEEMKDRIDSFQCPHVPPARGQVFKLADQIKNRQSATR